MIFQTKYNNEYTFLHKSIHIILGGILGIKLIPFEYKKILFLSILIYQFGQLFFNVRYFFNMNKLIKGNSIKHTLNKLLDFIFGYCIITIL